MLAAVRTIANKYQALRVSTLGSGWMDQVPPPVSGFSRKRYAPARTATMAPPPESTPAVTSEPLLGALGGGAPGGFRSGVRSRLSSMGGGRLKSMGGEIQRVSGRIGSIGGRAAPSTPFAIVTSGILQVGVWLLKAFGKSLPGDHK